MKSPKIREIIVITSREHLPCVVGRNGVHEIKDVGSEFPDSIHSQYDIFDENEKILRSIENCPVDVRYFSE